MSAEETRLLSEIIKCLPQHLIYSSDRAIKGDRHCNPWGRRAWRKCRGLLMATQLQQAKQNAKTAWQVVLSPPLSQLFCGEAARRRGIPFRFSHQGTWRSQCLQSLMAPSRPVLILWLRMITFMALMMAVLNLWVCKIRKIHAYWNIEPLKGPDGIVLPFYTMRKANLISNLDLRGLKPFSFSIKSCRWVTPIIPALRRPR